MAKLAANKSSLKTQRDRLALYQKFLPSLDLKRQQLLTEQKKARQQLAALQRDIEQLLESLPGLLEPLGASRAELSGLVVLESVELEEENIVGARLPVLVDLQFRTAAYSTLAKPFWVDFLVERLRQMATLQVRLQVARQRLSRLDKQVRRITQRVNLFEKVLIPRAQHDIKRIRIHLAEDERTAVVRSKIAKRKG